MKIKISVVFYLGLFIIAYLAITDSLYVLYLSITILFYSLYRLLSLLVISGNRNKLKKILKKIEYSISDGNGIYNNDMKELEEISRIYQEEKHQQFLRDMEIRKQFK